MIRDVAIPASTKHWKPTLKQIRAAQALVDPSVGTNYADVAKKAGVSRVALSNYLKNPDFCALIQELLPQHTDNLVALAWKVLYEKLVIDKDLEAAKLLFRLKKQIADVTNVKVTNNILKFERCLMGDQQVVKRVIDETALEPDDAEFSEAEV